MRDNGGITLAGGRTFPAQKPAEYLRRVSSFLKNQSRLLPSLPNTQPSSGNIGDVLTRSLTSP